MNMANEKIIDRIVKVHDVEFGTATCKILDSLHEREKFMKILVLSSGLGTTLGYLTSPDKLGGYALYDTWKNQDFNITLAQSATERDMLRGARNTIIGYTDGGGIPMGFSMGVFGRSKSNTIGYNEWKPGEHQFWQNIVLILNYRLGE